MHRRKKLLIRKVASLVVSVALLSVLLMGVTFYQQGVEFADHNLEKAIRENINSPVGPIPRSYLLQITHLDAAGYYIDSLKDIEKLPRLVYLNLENNQVEDLSPLQKISRLTELNLRANNIADISPLSSLSGLRILDLRENRIEDISALKNLTELTELNLRENEIKDISALSALTNLIYLNLHSNRDIHSVMPLKKLTNLESLILRNVPVGEEIEALKGMTALRSLNLKNCDLTDTTVLGDLMAVGALQDDVANDVRASVNIEDNPFQFRVKDQDVFLPIRNRWSTITERRPFALPRTISSIEPPLFSHPGGFYEESFYLSFETHDPVAKVYFTLDGSEPCPDNTDVSVYHYKNSYTTNPGDPFGELLSRSYQTHFYQNPIYIKSGGPGEDFQDCICKINTTRFSRAFDPPGDVFRGTVVRAIAYKDGHLPSEVVTHSYFVGEGIIERYHVPVISLVTDEKNFFSYDIGISVAGKTFDQWRDDNLQEDGSGWNPGNYFQRGRHWEKHVNFELYSYDGLSKINQMVGIRLHGNAARSTQRKSFRLYARIDYGNEEINYQFFLSERIDRFKRIILRNSGNDRGSTLFRDVLMQNLIKDLNIDQQSYESVILYINGVYWGIYNIRDRLDRYYLEYKYSVDPNNLDLITYGVVFENDFVLLDQDGKAKFTIDVKEGDEYHYNNMLRYIEFNDLTDATVFNEIKSMMDVENFIDFNIANIYFRNDDWPHNNNDFWRLRTKYFEPAAPQGHDGRWRWIIYDTDFGFGLVGGEDAYTHDTLEYASRNNEWSTFLFKSLLENADFKNEFINRFADYMNTIFEPQIVIWQIDAIQENLAPLMQEHIDRWGQPKSYGQWEENVEVMRVFAWRRPDYVRGHIIDKFSLSGLVQVNLKADSRGGKIQINSTIVTEDIPGIENPSNWTGTYFKDVPITIRALPNPGYRFARWEGIESEKQELTIILEEDLNLTAVFIAE